MPFLLALPILGCLACLALHALTYAGYGGAWVMYAAVGLFLGTFVTLIATSAVAMVAPPGQEKRYGWRVLVRAAPRPAKWLLGAAVVYGAASLAVMLIRHEGQTAIEPGGVLTLRHKGEFVRTLTPDQFRWHQNLVARGISGAVLAIDAGAATVVFGTMCQLRRGRQREERRAGITAATHASPTQAPVTLLYGQETAALAVWTHLLLFNLLTLAGFVGLPVLMLTVLTRLPLPPLLSGLLFFSSGLGGALLVRYLFTAVIPARCPNCLGRAYCESRSKMIRYVCRDCGCERTSTT